MNEVTEGEGYIRQVLLLSNLIVLLVEVGNFLVFVMDRRDP